MIPPCDPTVLENNPQFKKLYQNLTLNLLNPDGSTRAHDAQPDRKSVTEELKQCQIQSSKMHIKKRTLRRLALDPDSGLLDEIREPAAVISLYLDSSSRQLNLDQDAPRPAVDVLSLLGPDIDAFYADLPSLMPHFSRAISSSLQDLRSIADAGISAGNIKLSAEGGRPRHRARQSMAKIVQASLSSQLGERMRNLRLAQLSELPAARAKMAATAARVLAMRAEVLERTVTLLERAKHGALARATKAKAEHLAMVAQGVEGKLSVMQLDISATIHTPEATAALARYRQHLQSTREHLEDRRIRAQGELQAYAEADSGTSGPVKEIARKYGQLLQEIENVRLEIQRLSG